MSRQRQPCVYLITNLRNSKTYVGKTIYPNLRWKQHLTAAKLPKHHMPIVRALKKHGPSNFRFEILETFDTEEAALKAEMSWIRYYRSNDPEKGYNLDSVGLGGKSLTSTIREKISQALKGRTLTPDHIQKISSVKRGRRLSEETKRKMSFVRRGKSRPLATREKIAAAKRGSCLSEETKRKIANSLRGRIASESTREKRSQSLKGRPRSPEAKANIKASWAHRRWHAEIEGWENLAGKLPDSQVAVLGKISRSTVCRYRKKYEIPAFVGESK